MKTLFFHLLKGSYLLGSEMAIKSKTFSLQADTLAYELSSILSFSTKHGGPLPQPPSSSLLQNTRFLQPCVCTCRTLSRQSAPSTVPFGSSYYLPDPTSGVPYL